MSDTKSNEKTIERNAVVYTKSDGNGTTITNELNLSETFRILFTQTSKSTDTFYQQIDYSEKKEREFYKKFNNAIGGILWSN